MILRLKLALRRVIKSGVFSYLNGGSLAISIAGVIAIYTYSNNELKTDSHFTGQNEIFRIVRSIEEKESSYKTPMLAAPYRKMLSDELGLPLSSISRVYTEDELVRYRKNTFFEPNFVYADENFFDIMDYKFKLGDPAKALSKTNAVIITDAMARKYFGDRAPLGEVIDVEDKGPFVVSGVLASPKFNSHLDFDFVVNNKSMGYTQKFLDDKEAHVMSFYLRIPETAVTATKRRLNSLSNTVFNSKNDIAGFSLNLQQLKDIYFGERLVSDDVKHGNLSLVKSLIVIAIIICLLIITNFINLTVARLAKRLGDIGVKKILGSDKKALIADWSLELYVMIIIGTAFGLFLYYTIFPNLFHSVFGVEVVNPDFAELSIFSLIITIALTVLIMIIPILLFTNVTPHVALSGKLGKLKTNILQYSLLLFQFLIAFVLICFTLAVNEQFRFMQQKEMGLSEEQIVLFDSNNKDSWKNKEFIKSEIRKLNGVKDVSMVFGGIPSSITEPSSYEREGVHLNWNTAFVEPNMIDILALEILEGRGFIAEMATDMQNGIVLNATAAKQLGWPHKPVVGTKIMTNGEGEYKMVIGIIKDYHYESLRNKIDPLVLQSNDYGETFVVKLKGEGFQKTLENINDVWRVYVPGHQFSYRFLDDTFQKMLSEDTQQGKIVYLFTILTLLIACIGTLSLSSFVQQLKLKELAIRKILGSSITELFLSLSKKIGLTLLYSGIVGVPVAWYFINHWLDGFSYRIAASPLLFIWGFLLLGSIVIALVFVQSRKILLNNPVLNLKN